MTVRIGKPLDIFGNFVDEDGRSYGPGGRTVDPARWLTSRGELRSDPQRDHEYTRELGLKLVDRYHKDNTVLPSHVVAFTLFELLRTRYPDLDLYRFLRLSLPQRSVTLSDFKGALDLQLERLRKYEAQGALFLAPELRALNNETWFKQAVDELGLFHDLKVVALDDQTIWTEDLSLLYYYRNRLTGYGLSNLATSLVASSDYTGLYDEKRFLV
jgi:glycerol-3-phosphate O-acyltransferase